MTDAITSQGTVFGASGTGSSVSRIDPGGSMGEDTFLKLLMAQMTASGPAAADRLGADDHASSHSSRTSRASTSSTSRSTALNLGQDFAGSVTMIGKTVTWLDDEGTSQSGVVEAVKPSPTGALLMIGADGDLHRPGPEGRVGGSPPRPRRPASARLAPVERTAPGPPGRRPRRPAASPTSLGGDARVPLLGARRGSGCRAAASRSTPGQLAAPRSPASTPPPPRAAARRSCSSTRWRWWSPSATAPSSRRCRTTRSGPAVFTNIDSAVIT